MELETFFERLQAYLNASEEPSNKFEKLIRDLFDPEDGYFSPGHEMPQGIPENLKDALKDIYDNENITIEDFQYKIELFQKDYFPENNNNNNNNVVMINNNGHVGGKKRKTKKSKRNRKYKTRKHKSRKH